VPPGGVQGYGLWAGGDEPKAITLKQVLYALSVALVMAPGPGAADPPSLEYTPEHEEAPRKRPAPVRVTLKTRPRVAPGPRSWVRRPAPAPRRTQVLSPHRNVGWGGGEMLTYAVSLSGVQAGRAAISVGHPKQRKGRSVLALRGLGETVPFIQTFADMREEVNTRIDLSGVLPLSSTTNRRTGKPDEDRWMRTNFDRLVSQRIKKQGKRIDRKRRIPGPLHDPISALFALRSLRLRTGDRLRMLVLNGNSLYEVKLKVVGRERIYTKLGPRDAIRIDGLGRRVFDDGVRPVPGKKVRSVSLWLGVGAARLPLKLRGDTKLGPIVATVTSHSPPRSGLRVRVATAR